MRPTPQADFALEALAKATYERLFRWLVLRYKSKVKGSAGLVSF